MCAVAWCPNMRHALTCSLWQPAPGKSARLDEISEEQASGLRDLSDSAVPLARVHRLIDELSQKETLEGGASKLATVASDDPADADEEEDAEVVQKKELHRSSKMQTALKVTANLRDSNSKPWPQIASRSGMPDWASPAQASEQAELRMQLLQTRAGPMFNSKAKCESMDGHAPGIRRASNRRA